MGQIAGIDITIRASWLLIAGLIAVTLAPQIQLTSPGLGPFAYVVGLAFAVLLYMSVLMHELSHALAAKAFGLPVRSVSLHFLGGVTEIEGEPQTPPREFVVSVVGPLTSLAVGGLALLAARALPPGLLLLAVEVLAGVNLLVGVLNLAPGLPLDGGRILRALVWWVSGKPQLGTVVAGWAGRGVAVLALGFPFALERLTGQPADLLDYAISFIVAMFLWGGATQAMAASRVRSKLPALQARRLARRAIAVPHDLPLGEAIRRARDADAGGLVVVAGDGRPIGVVNEAAVLSIPEQRRPWVSCGSVARSIEPGLLLDADLSGEGLVRAMRDLPATEYVLLDRGQVFGVLTSRDVDAAFSAA
jgi:Zn-dependent protease/CBS domain-containing protein